MERREEYMAALEKASVEGMWRGLGGLLGGGWGNGFFHKKVFWMEKNLYFCHLKQMSFCLMLTQNYIAFAKTIVECL